MNSFDREVYRESRSLAHMAPDIDASRVFLDDPIGDRETEPRPLSDPFGGEEWVVDLLDILS